MSHDGQPRPAVGRTSDELEGDDCFVGPIDVVTFPMPAGLVFDWHVHAQHQLAWAASGVLTVRTSDAAWVLPPTRALWIPAGVRHETLSEGLATMRTGYVQPDLCPIDWPTCTPLLATPLLTELISFLEDASRDPLVREHAMTMLLDLLEPVGVADVDVRMPVDPRARQVAEALAAAPADDRTLADWGADVGASARTLARSFQADTGLTFGRWRSLLRLKTAMVELGRGTSVANVAELVGYESPSAFVAAFRRATGMTPAAYFRTDTSRSGRARPLTDEPAAEGRDRLDAGAHRGPSPAAHATPPPPRDPDRERG